ncbi:unnamed protein product [Prunus brigantina]
MQKHFEIRMLYKNRFSLKEYLQSKYRFDQLQLTSVIFRDMKFRWARTMKVMRRRIGRPKVMIARITKKNRDRLSFFLTSSLCPKHPLSPPSPQPSAPPAKGLRRHHNRSPEVVLPSPFWPVFEFQFRPFPAIF